MVLMTADLSIPAAIMSMEAMKVYKWADCIERSCYTDETAGRRTLARKKKE